MKKLFKGILIITFFLLIVGAVLLALERLEEYEKSTKQSPREVPPVSVWAVQAKPKIVRQWVLGEGTVRAERREFVNFETSGKVTYIGKERRGRELREGSVVTGPGKGKKRGQLLAKLDDREQMEALNVRKASLAEALQRVKNNEIQLEQAVKKERFAKKQLERSKKLYQRKMMARSQFEESKIAWEDTQAAIRSTKVELEAYGEQIKILRHQVNQAKIDLQKTRLYAPMSGVIAYLNLRKGDIVAGDTGMRNEEKDRLRTTPFVIISQNRFEVTINLPVYSGDRVRVGQSVLISGEEPNTPENLILQGNLKQADNLNNRSYITGKIYSVSPAIDPVHRTIQVKIRTDSGNPAFRDGMFVTCFIIVQEKENALVAPIESLIFRDNQFYLFTVDPKSGAVAERSVKIGIEESEYVEILGGIKQGEWLVTDGRYRVANGMTVKMLKKEQGVRDENN